MAALRFDHIVFVVSDAAATRRFYGEVLGLPLVQAYSGADWGGFPWLMMFFALGCGRLVVPVVLRGAPRPAPDALPRDARHLAFAVSSREEQEAWRARLVAAGVETWDEDHGTQRSIYFADPDGLVLEIATPPSDEALPTDPRAEETVRAFLKS
jgi:catechol 2,3-dioxygenase-like lactoylglutathione lyase family enzyme